jgi:hypothetical protein
VKAPGVFSRDAAGLKRVSVDARNQQRRLQRTPFRIRKILHDRMVNRGNDIGAVFVEQRTFGSNRDGDALLAYLQHRRDAGGLAGTQNNASHRGGLKTLARDRDPVFTGVESLDREET